MLRPWDLKIEIDKQSDQAVYLQIADAIISDIHSGRLKAGDALPGSRNLAQLLQVNRNTVVQALDVLINEGWLISKSRKGIFVSDTLPGFSAAKQNRPSLVKENKKTQPAPAFHIFFDDGRPDSKIAPMAELSRAYRQIFNRKAKWRMMEYGSAFGDLEFRIAIAQMLNHQRGMRVNENSICITRGSQMAMYLIAQCFFEKDDCVIVENPGYKSAWRAFEMVGAKVLPVKLDKDGLIVDDVIALLASNPRIKAIYITPHRQYPTTVTLSLQRRLKLIELSNQYGFTIIEDDYDNEFHFGYRPLLPMSSFLELKNYIYVGTMSKVVAPALRIGYLATSSDVLLKKIGDLRKIIDVQGDTIMEKAVLELIIDGTMKRHIRKATHHYKLKRDLMADLLAKYLHHVVNYDLPEGGLAFWIEPKKTVNWNKIITKLHEKGIDIVPPTHYTDDESANSIRLGYGSLSEDEMEEGLKILGNLLSN